MDPENARAYLGLAMVSADGFDEKATEYAAKAIALDPKLVEAHEFAANLVLEDAKSGRGGEGGADGVGDCDPDALDAMATLAAVNLLADKNAEADAWLKKMTAVNPGYGQGYAMRGAASGAEPAVSGWDCLLSQGG